MMNNKKRKGFKFRAVTGIVLFLFTGGIIFSLLINQRIPEHPAQSDYLTDLDIYRVREALNLRTELGTEVWPGWGEHAAPLLIYSDGYAFLIGTHTAPAGWEDYAGIFRSAQNRDWQAFAEKLENGVWVGCMSTKTALDLFLVEEIGGIIPDPLDSVLPLGLLVVSTDRYITSLLHEDFHAFQASVSLARFEAAQGVYLYADDYQIVDEEMRLLWKEEGWLLAQALQAETEDERIELIRQWLAIRNERRLGLSPELVDFEIHLEWLEGLAKYVELEIWQTASLSNHYTPLKELSADDLFHAYDQFESRYRGEISTLQTVVTQSGDSRFYYTGMAQALLLDELMPDWKSIIFKEGVWLEQLLADAIEK